MAIASHAEWRVGLALAASRLKPLATTCRRQAELDCIVALAGGDHAAAAEAAAEAASHARIEQHPLPTISDLHGGHTVSAITDIPSHAEGGSHRITYTVHVTATELEVLRRLVPFFAPALREWRRSNWPYEIVAVRGSDLVTVARHD